MFRLCISFIFTLLWFIPATAQFSGILRVGSESNDDFPSLSLAMDTLQKVGINGYTELRLEPGSYGSFYLSQFNLNGNDTLVIRPQILAPSASANTQVLFDRMHLDRVHNLVLQDLQLSLKVLPGFGGPYTLRLESVQNVKVLRCRLVDSLSSYTANVGVLDIIYPFSGVSSNIDIEDSYLEQQGSGAYVVHQEGRNGRCTFKADSILGQWYVRNENFQLYHSYLLLKGGLDRQHLGRAQACVFHLRSNRFGSKSDPVGFRSIRQCTIKGVSPSSTSVLDTLVNSWVQTDFQISNRNFNGLVQDNRFEGIFGLSFAKGGLIARNYFFGRVGAGSSPVEFRNNFFFDAVRSRFGQTDFYHNSFGPQSHLEYYGSGQLVHNLFNRLALLSLGVNLRYNNYADLSDAATKIYSHQDPGPTYYPPHFVAADDLHIGNPLLFGAGQGFTSLSGDIDGEVRGLHPTLGADEACFKLGDGDGDTLHAECGSTVVLKTCPNLLGFGWQPSAALLNPALLQPQVRADSSLWLFLVDSLGQRQDSVYLQTEAPAVYGKTTQYPFCGFAYPVSTYLPNGASVLWRPSALVSDSNAAESWVTVFRDTLLVAEVQTQCGRYFDTIDLRIDPAMAYSDFRMDSTADCYTRYFTVNVPCKDSLRWDLGDGTISRLDSFYHQYGANGTYPIKLEFWRDSLYGKLEFYVARVNCLSVDEEPWRDFAVYPNPTHRRFNLEGENLSDFKKLQIYGLDGRLLWEQTWAGAMPSSFAPDLPRGTYLLRLINRDGQSESRRLIMGD